MALTPGVDGTSIAKILAGQAQYGTAFDLTVSMALTPGVDGTSIAKVLAGQAQYCSPCL
jgi:hypothetical protein